MPHCSLARWLSPGQPYTRITIKFNVKPHNHIRPADVRLASELITRDAASVFIKIVCNYPASCVSNARLMMCCRAHSAATYSQLRQLTLGPDDDVISAFFWDLLSFSFTQLAVMAPRKKLSRWTLAASVNDEILEHWVVLLRIQLRLII